MKTRIISIVSLLILIGLAGCKKEDSVPETPPPVWQLAADGKYPLSMTAVVKVPEALSLQVAERDMVGAFLGEECRGIGTFIETGNTTVCFIMIHGTAAEQDSKLIFKYYNSGKSLLYSTEPFLGFEVDGSYGTVDHPEPLVLKLVK